ncbi:MAG: hypothetical protein PHH75_04215 [Candidatus Omnitrophica bacterium]|nr:hypothetical protein [Candidatus Omnitrophota bacterium]MDD5574363.1 hypothetical protein [Candidatus Omnitrophota bacterium]
MLRKYLVLSVMLAVLSGCAQCMLMRSEYYDMTGRVFMAKADDAEIPIYEIGQKIDRPCVEIGVVKVMAQPKTPNEELVEELKKRARLAGADALIETQFVEDVSNKTWFCGRLMSTRHNKSAVARAVVFTQEEDHGAGKP